jgi:phosphate/sulfate permease
MWSSRDIALVALFPVVNVIYTYLVGQLGWLLFGVPGSNMALIIGGVIINSVALLMFEGRRWRFLLMSVIFVILILPTNLVGNPFDIFPKIPSIINAIQADLLFNSLYGFFNKRNQLKLWSVICLVEFFLVNPLLTSIAFTFLFPPAFVSAFINVIIFLLPVSIAESVIGALIGFKIYEKAKKMG